jgi:hypothetical protein
VPEHNVEERLVIATLDELAVMPNDGIAEYGKVNIDLVLERWKAQCDRENGTFLAQWLAEHPPEVYQPAEKPARHRKPGLGRLIAQMEKAGKTVTSITTPDGHTLTFGEPQSSEANNPWLVDLDKVTKQ